MKFVYLVYGEEEKIGAMNDDECMEHDAAIRKSGQCIAYEALQQVKTAKTERVREGKVSSVDGPFAETKEALAGFYLLDAKEMNEALQIAENFPPVRQLVNTSGKERRV